MNRTTSRDPKLAYEVTGEGATIVLVPGGIGDRPGMENIQKELSSDFQVVNYDRRNSGLSAYLKLEPQQSDLVEQARDLNELLLELNFSDVVLIGHSYGALIALMASIRPKKPLRALILVEPPALSFLSELEPQTFQNLKSRYREFVSDIQGGQAEKGIKAFVEYSLGSGSWDRLPQGRKNKLCAAHENYLIMLKESLYFTPDIKKLQFVQTPTLLLRGEKSQDYFGRINEYLSGVFPNAVSRSLPNVGHGVFRHATPMAGECIRKFIHEN